MAVNLKKGQKVSLSKQMRLAMIGLGWHTNAHKTRYSFDLDASAFCLGSNGKVTCDEDFIFYNNLKHPTGCVTHTGDDREGGDGDGDDEVIVVDFSKVPDDIQTIAITVTIHDAEVRQQNFGQVSNAYVRVCSMDAPDDFDGANEQLKFQLNDEFSFETALIVCEIYRGENGWAFAAVGEGANKGLVGLCKKYGVNV